jgi:hypothetical protein
MAYNTRDFWIFGLCPLSDLISETLRSLEYRAMETPQNPVIPTIYLTA